MNFARRFRYLSLKANVAKLAHERVHGVPPILASSWHSFSIADLLDTLILAEPNAKQ